MADAAGLAVWVYGVTRAAVTRMPRRAGVDGCHDAGLIRHAGLAALASAVPLEEFNAGALERSLEDLGRLEAVARAHERVLDDALRFGPVVPFPICTLYKTVDRVRQMLDRERQSLAAVLDRLGGAAEWGVKAYRAAGREPPARRAGAGRPASGIEYLARRRGDRVAAEVARQAADVAVAFIHDRLSEHALDDVLGPSRDRRLSGRDDEMLLNAAYLVPDAHLAEFRALVADLARRHATAGIVLELTGPWPAYHFAASGDPG